MERQLCILDICGLDVGLIITDDKRLLGCKRGRPSFGRYSVDKGAIWLDVNLAPSMLRSHLLHEIYEFVLGYFNVTYHPGHEHESFKQASVSPSIKILSIGSHVGELACFLCAVYWQKRDASCRIYSCNL